MKKMRRAVTFLLLSTVLLAAGCQAGVLFGLLPPAPPTGLSAATATDCSLSVSWKMSLGATGYQVYRDTDAAGAFSVLAYSGEDLSFTDTGLEAAKAYWYKARATGSMGAGDLTTAVSASTLSSAGTAPAFTPAAGRYATAQNVAIASTIPGATIRYTTDGSAPTAASLAYTGPIPVAATTTVKAFAHRSGWTDSAVSAAEYVIDAVPPGEVAVIRARYLADGRITISWQDPGDADLDRIEIAYPDVSAPVAVEAGVMQQTISMPLKNAVRKFTFTAVDKTGNRSAGKAMRYTFAYPFFTKYSNYSLSTGSPVLSSYSIVERDANNRVIQQSSYNGSDVLQNRGVYQYSAAGVPERITYFDGSDALLYYNAYEYDSSGRSVTYSRYDAADTLTNYTVYEYDPGFFNATTESTSYNAAGVPSSRTAYEYDDRGCYAGYSNYSYSSTTGLWTLSSSRSYAYDADGRQVRYTGYSATFWTSTGYTTYEYDTDWNQTRYSNYDSTGALTSYTLYEY